MDLKFLHKQGLSIREIARQSGHSRNTVRRILRDEHDGQFQTPERASKLAPFEEHVRARFSEFRLSAGQDKGVRTAL